MDEQQIRVCSVSLYGFDTEEEETPNTVIGRREVSPILSVVPRRPKEALVRQIELEWQKGENRVKLLSNSFAHLAPVIGVFCRRTTVSSSIYKPAGRVEKAEIM